jgi:hypothetical protein
VGLTFVTVKLSAFGAPKKKPFSGEFLVDTGATDTSSPTAAPTSTPSGSRRSSSWAR